MSELNKEEQKRIVTDLLAGTIKDAIRYCQQTYPDAEVHSIMVYAHANHMTKETEYAISLDVKDKGNIFFGLIQ